MALMAGSAGWARLQGWRQRLYSQVNLFPPLCPAKHSVWPSLRLALLRGAAWLSAMCKLHVLHPGRYLGSAFQARAPRGTPIRVLLDISLLQHPPSDLSESCWVYLHNISSIHPPLATAAVTSLLPATGMSPDYWGQFLTGLPASAPVLGTAARVVLDK